MYLSILKEEEKKLFLGFVYYVAASEGNIGDEEKKVIGIYCNEMMIEPVYDKPELSCIQVVDNISRMATEKEKKIILFEILGLAMADNRYDKSEKNMIHDAAKKFGLSDEFVIQCEQTINEYITFQSRLNNLILS